VGWSRARYVVSLHVAVGSQFRHYSSPKLFQGVLASGHEILLRGKPEG